MNFHTFKKANIPHRPPTRRSVLWYFILMIVYSSGTDSERTGSGVWFQSPLRLKITSLWAYLDKFYKFGIRIHYKYSHHLLFISYFSSTSPFHYLWMSVIGVWYDLHCLLRPVCPKTYINYGNVIKSNPIRSHPGSAPALETFCSQFAKSDIVRRPCVASLVKGTL